MTADEIKDQIIQKQDKYIKHFKASYYHSSMSFRYGNFFFSRKVKKIENELASLRQQLEKAQKTKLSLPLDVPTDEEIKEYARTESIVEVEEDGEIIEYQSPISEYYEEGAKWAIEQIIERNQK